VIEKIIGPIGAKTFEKDSLSAALYPSDSPQYCPINDGFSEYTPKDPEKIISESEAER
jgi:hypothetical protein